MQEDQPLQVARCTKIIQDEKDPEKSKYVINVKQIAKFVVNLGDRVSPTDIEEGMRVGYVSVSLQPLYFTLWENITNGILLIASIGINIKSSCLYPPKSTPALR